jgi:hypothetical protein
MEQDYQTSIARAREADNISRQRRRALRNAQQERVVLAREAHARRCFLRDIRVHIARRSIAEENVMYTLRTTAACWADVCDRAITRQLDMEAAQKDHARGDADYLEYTREREMLEQLNTEESDTSRWKELNARRAVWMQTMCTEAAQSAVADIWTRTSQCITMMHQCRLHHNGTNQLVTLSADSLLLTPTPSRGNALRSSPAATKEAFRHIFNGSPHLRCSAAFIALLRYSYAQFRVAVPLANVLRLCPVPILAVDGPKYSGKTLLTDFLKARYRLLCISDESLVRRALQAAQTTGRAMDRNNSGSGSISAGATAEKAEGGVEGGEGEGGVTASGGSSHASTSASAEWAAHGQRIHDELLSGGSVSAATVIDLLYLFLHELQAGGAELPYDALFLEGVFRTADSYKMVARRFHSLPVHPFESLRWRWNLASAAPDDDDNVGEPPAQPSAGEVAVSGGAADVPGVLRLPNQLTSEHDPSAKQEPKTRPVKKVDLAALPPPELPDVDDTAERQAMERAFVAKANHELASLPTVLSGLLHIQCSPEEVFRRFAGLRLDVETGTVYHLTYNPPPTERLPHLVNMGRPDVASVELHEGVFRHREEWAAVQRWLTRQQPGSVFARVYELAGDSAVAQVQENALQVVEQILANFRMSRQVLTERDAAAARLAVLEAAEKTQIAEREGTRLRLAAAYNEKGVPLPPLLQTPVEGSTGRPVAVFGTPAATVVLQAVSDFTEEYEEEYGAAWLRTTQLTTLLLEYFNGAEAQMAAYWTRPDDKQTMLKRFQSCLDTVPAHLRARAACKAELHLGLDDLSDALHHCIELRDAEARGLIDALCGPASFLVGWEMLLCQNFVRLLQCEADRFLLTLHLFTFFFGAITGEPLAFDDVEIEVPVLNANPADRPAHTPAAAAAGGATPMEALPASANFTPRSSKEKRTTTSKKTHGKAAEESQEKTVEEQFADAVQGVLSGITSVTDRLKGVLDAQAKGQRRTGGGGGGGSSSGIGNLSGAATAHFSHVTAKVLELMEAEKSFAAARVAAVHSYVQTLLREAETHAQQRRAHLESTLVSQMSKEAAAANTAIYVLRGCVEAERKSPQMHLGCTTFAVTQGGTLCSSVTASCESAAEASILPAHTSSTGGGTEARRSFITDVPLSSQLRDPQLLLHPGLTAARLLELVQQFRCVAPDYQLSRFDFFVLVRRSDYAEAAATRLDTAHMAIKSREEVFFAFDPQRSGFLDWRELVVHLLFWVVPTAVAPAPSAVHNAQKKRSAAVATVGGGMPEVSLEDLMDVRTNAGCAPLSEEQFFDLPFFYDRYLDDVTLEAYTRVLWCTFCNAATQMVDPSVLLGFLCADPQPIRGAQKAFQLLSPPESAARVTLDEMDALCHLKANNARAMNQLDPCSKLNLRLLFGAASTLAFEDVCLSPIGRKMLNHADLYRRRTFVKRKTPE